MSAAHLQRVCSVCRGCCNDDRGLPNAHFTRSVRHGYLSEAPLACCLPADLLHGRPENGLSPCLALAPMAMPIPAWFSFSAQSSNTFQLAETEMAGQTACLLTAIFLTAMGS